MVKDPPHIGLWLIGACGGVGTTVALGVAALRRKLAPPTGLVTALPAFQDIGLVDPAAIVVGGHEICGVTLPATARELHTRANIFQSDPFEKCLPDLQKMQRNIRPGTWFGVGDAIRAVVKRTARDQDVSVDSSPIAAIERLSADIAAFRKRHKLGHVIVVNLASSEPPLRLQASHGRWSTLARDLARPNCRTVPTSAIYALAAFEAGSPYVNFTPSPALVIPAVRKRADTLGLPYMGNDGKTGETLVKSALAPMFASRNLRVLSWIGQNLLGNRDGAVLTDPATRLSKIRSKDKVVSRIVGGQPVTSVSIEYVPSLDDWKVAWNLIHFEGFLSTRMTMQFTWQGCDSALAAPLVIDLARLAEFEIRHGSVGPMPHLAFFFKDPIDADRHDLAGQWDRLISHVRRPRRPSATTTPA